jgi:hypothetical protein
MRIHPVLRTACRSLLPLLLAAATSVSGQAQTPAETAADRMRRIKELESSLLMREGRERIAEAQRRRAGAVIPATHERMRPSGDQERAILPLRETGESPSGARRAPRAENITGTGFATNVRVNDTTGDDPFSSQNEPSVAAWGNYVVVAYNDLPSLDFASSLQGFAYSTDGGASFVDGGVVPVPADSFLWTSDPIIAVNEKSGEFYFCGLLETLENDITGESINNGVGVVHGTFVGNTLVWDLASVVHIAPSVTHFIDKPWIAADSLSGNIYVSYSDFLATSNSILFQRSANDGLNWSSPITLSSPAAIYGVQGSRPAVGPNGEVYVTWKEVGPYDPGYDLMRIRASTDRGQSFDPEHTVATFFDNFGTGAPGFNRERSIALPSIAVDRTVGPHRGRLYVGWNESLNWYDDTPLFGPVVSPIEDKRDNFFTGATPFDPGQTLSAAFNDTLDVDFFEFSATQGVSYVFWADNVPLSLYSMRVFCSDTVSRIAFTGRLDLPIDDTGNQSILVWTAPTTGTYYLRMFYVNLGGDPGPYEVRTGIARVGPGDRGRDQRDVFVAWSDNVAAWSTPVRVNQDPPCYDDWLPEVSVSGYGTVYSAWYDFRDGPAAECGSVSNVYIARSEDSGPTWVTLGSLSDAPSVWTPENSNLVPNQGDYVGLFANQLGVYGCWTDKRGNDPDIYSAVLLAAPDTLQVSASAEATSSRIIVTWQFRVPRVVDATLHRAQDTNAAVSLGPVSSDASGNFVYEDTQIVRGSRYTYTLGIPFGASEVQVGEVSATVPTGRLIVRPNPLTHVATIEYDVPSPGGEVSVVIYDLLGRAVRKLASGFQLAGPQQLVWDAKDNDGRVVRPGVYLLRLNEPGEAMTQRVSLIP